MGPLDRGYRGFVMADQDFTTYTENDPSNRIRNITASKLELEDHTGSEETYLYKDMGAAHFDGDFIHHATVDQHGSSSYPRAGIFGVANAIGSQATIDTAASDFLVFDIVRSNFQTRLTECDGGTLYSSAWTSAISINNTEFVELERDEAVGTYGTLYIRVYDDATKTTLDASGSLALHSKKDYRYHYAILGLASGTTSSIDGYVENLSLNEAAAAVPSPRTNLQGPLFGPLGGPIQ